MSAFNVTQAQADIPIFAMNLMSQQSQLQFQQQQMERAQQMLDQQAAGGNAPLGRLISSLAGSYSGGEDDADELAADDAAARAAAVNESSVVVNKGSAADILQVSADDLQALNETLASTTQRVTTTTTSSDDDEPEPPDRLNNHHHHHHKTRPRAQFVYLPSGISVQFCDADNRSCLDENAVCKLGACVCKPGYFVRRQSPSGLCQSISDLMKNCESDLQCQAFNVDLICDQTNNSGSSNNSTDGAFCDCTPGLYYDLETNTCLPCQRPSASTVATTVAFNDTQASTSNSSQLARNASAPLAPTDGATSGRPTPPPLCRPLDLAKLATRRKHKHFSFPVTPTGQASESSRPTPPSDYHNSVGPPPTWTAYLGASHAHNNHNPNPHHTPASSSSDPLRIKTPIDVFMGAIMLFTLFTVAWFFLQRIIHDCRTIMKSLRTSAGGGGPADLMLAPDANFTGRHIGPLFGEHHPLEVNGQSLAAARLAAALAAASAQHRHDSVDYNNGSINSPDGAGAGFFARRSTGGGGGCGSPIGYMATTLTGSSLARYHRLLAASFQAAAAATSTTSPTTLPNSNSQAGLATAVTNSGQNSAASTRSTITRLVGDGIQSPDPELGAYTRGLNHFPIIMPHYHGAFLPATPNYLASSAFEAPPPKYEEAIAQQDCSFFGYIHASGSPPPPPPQVTSAHVTPAQPASSELAENSGNNQCEEPCASSVQPDEEINERGNPPSELQPTAEPIETTVDCETPNRDAVAHA